MTMKSIYIVGAQCTGKTTLTEALAHRIKETFPSIAIELINEMARSVLEKYRFTRDDVRNNPQRCIELQKLILYAQHQREITIVADKMLISDRSGLDPVVYASMFAKDQIKSFEDLQTGTEWEELKVRMRQAVVVVCEPVQEWLFDDGIRLMPTSMEEWTSLHDEFRKLLHENEISYTILPSALMNLAGRVDFVLSLWKNCSERCTTTDS